MKLDRTRPYGTVYGPADHAYEQDNKRFDHDGNEIVGKDLPKKREPKPKADQLAAQRQVHRLSPVQRPVRFLIGE